MTPEISLDIDELPAPTLKYSNVLSVVFFHRRGAEGAESDYFLFAAEGPANKKTQALQAKRKSDLQIAWFHIFLKIYQLPLYILP